MFFLVVLLLLREGAKKGERVAYFCLNIAMFVELVTVCAYTMLAPEIHKLAALGNVIAL
jgi:hypothetical protein